MDALLRNLDLVEGLPDHQLVDAAQRIAVLAGRIEALQVHIAGEIEKRSKYACAEDNLARAHGCRTSVELLKQLTGESAWATRQRVRLAEVTTARTTLTGEPLAPRYPHVGKALEAGLLPIESALAITKMLDKPRSVAVDPDLMDTVERNLVQSASGLDMGVDEDADIRVPVDSVRVMCGAWAEVLDPDGEHPDDTEVLRGRFLRLGAERNGRVALTASLLPEVAATLGRMLDAIGSPRVQTADDTLSVSSAKSGTVPGPNVVVDAEKGPWTGFQETETNVPAHVLDERSPDQKRHDHFASALNLAVQSESMPTLGGAPITVLVQVTQESLADKKGRATLHDYSGSTSSVSMDVAHRGACCGSWQTLVQDSNGRIVSLSSPQRIFNSNQRKAIMTRDKGCIIPGCEVPSTWCEVHHVKPHALGGETHTDNGVLLCFYHHRTIDSNGWDITMKRGVPHVKPPRWLLRYFTWDRRMVDQFSTWSDWDSHATTGKATSAGQIEEVTPPSAHVDA